MDLYQTKLLNRASEQLHEKINKIRTKKNSKSTHRKKTYPESESQKIGYFKGN